MCRLFSRIVILLVCVLVTLISCTPIRYTKESGLGNPSIPSPSSSYEPESIWTLLANDFDLSDETPENPEVRKQINWYVSHPKYFKRVTNQARPYLYYIYQQVKRRHLPAEIALLPMVESAYNPFAYSKVGAAGLWQMMPGTASGFGLKVDWWYDGRRDIIASTNAALDYLTYLGDFFNGDWLLAIAAYDAGEGTIEGAIRYNAKRGKSTSFWDLPLSSETKSYVPKLLAIATIIKYPDEYPIDLPFIKNEPYLAAVDIGSQIDLAHAATMAEMNLGELTALNPGFSRFATDPNGPNILLLPIDKAALFERQLKQLPKEQRITWVRYEVKTKDSINRIAKQYNMNVHLLREINRLETNRLRKGQVLLIPTSTSRLTKVIFKPEQNDLMAKRKLPEVDIIYYTVKQGDSFAKVAKKFRITEKQIRFWNGIKRQDTLKPGQQLVIWPSKRRKTVSSSRYSVIHHQVHSGESLYLIAHRYQVPLDTLRQANHLKNNSTIRVGQQLIIPSSKRKRVINYHQLKVKYHRSPVHHQSARKSKKQV